MTKSKNMSDVYVSLRDHFESRIVAVERATSIASVAMEKRLEGMNEFRDALKDQASKFVTRIELEACITKLQSDIRELMKYKDIAEGKASQLSVTISLVLAIIGIAISIIRVFK